MKRNLTVAGATVVAAALLAAGCGSSGATTTSATSTDDWANSLCTATSTWTGALQDAATSLKDGPFTSATLDDAATQVKDATNTYVEDLKGLGKPDTQAGQDAKTAVDKLQTDLQTGLDSMKAATENVSGAAQVMAAISSVTGTLSTLTTEMKSTFTQLKGLDAKGELDQAFSQSDACASLSA